jgi:hypothetical protein
MFKPFIILIVLKTILVVLFKILVNDLMLHLATIWLQWFGFCKKCGLVWLGLSWFEPMFADA